LRQDAESGGSSGSETASDNSAHLKVSAMAALAGIIYDFGPLTIMKARLASLEIPATIFLKVCASRPSRYVSVINDNHLVSLMNFNAAKVN
jgi:hypothetical protein